MNDIAIALLIGILAGVVDVIPMIKKRVPWHSTVSVFAQWVLLGLLIPFVRWGVEPWLKGMIIGALGMAPTMILAINRNLKSLGPTLAYGVILGAAIGLAGEQFIGRSLLRDLGL